MCEWLVKLTDNIHPDPIKDKSGSYKRGDVVVVKDDGWNWGTQEGLPKFAVLKVTDRTERACLKYVESESDGDDPVTRRLYHIVMDELPAQVLRDMDNSGAATIAWATLVGLIENKVTVSRETA